MQYVRILREMNDGQTRPSHIIHGTGGLFAAGFIAACRAELILRFGVFACFVHGFLAGILGDVFWVILEARSDERAMLMRVRCDESTIMHTFHFCLVCFGFPHHQCCCFTIERIRRVRVAEKLRQEDFKDVDHVIHGGPCLIDHIKTDRPRAARTGI